MVLVGLAWAALAAWVLARRRVLLALCDAPATPPATVDGVIHAARSARSLPGYGGLPLPELLDLLPAGPYSLEVPNDVLRRELGTAEFARLLLTLARALVADHGEPAAA